MSPKENKKKKTGELLENSVTLDRKKARLSDWARMNWQPFRPGCRRCVCVCVCNLGHIQGNPWLSPSVCPSVLHLAPSLFSHLLPRPVSVGTTFQEVQGQAGHGLRGVKLKAEACPSPAVPGSKGKVLSSDSQIPCRKQSPPAP